MDEHPAITDGPSSILSIEKKALKRYTEVLQRKILLIHLRVPARTFTLINPEDSSRTYQIG